MTKISRKKVDTSLERSLLIGLITNERVLREIKPLYEPELFRIPFSHIIAGWCFDFYEAYDRPPGGNIQAIFEKWEEDEQDHDNAELIADFLQDISDEFDRADKFNADYLLDRVEEHFNKINLKAFAQDIKEAAKTNPAAAEELIANHRVIKRYAAISTNPFTNQELINESFKQAAKPLFKLPGALGRMIPSPERDGFMAVMGPEKRGKTWWLMQFAMWAAKQRCNVAFFQVGDMSEIQMTRRLHIHLAGRNIKKKYCGDIKVPIMDCLYNQLNTCNDAPTDIQVAIKTENGIEYLEYGSEDCEGYEACSECRENDPPRWKGAVWYMLQNIEPLMVQDAIESGGRFDKLMRRKSFKLSTHKADSVSVTDIDRELDIWSYHEGWIPDVIVIDYADILAPLNTMDNYRHQQNKTWMALRALSQKWHGFVLTATQADALSYKKDSIDESNFSEDKRKFGHVNQGVLTLNQTPEEKRRQVMRLGQMFIRDDEFDVLYKTTVLQCLQRGRPYLGSF